MTSHSEHYFQFYVDKKEESLSKHYNDSYASKTSRSQYSIQCLIQNKITFGDFGHNDPNSKISYNVRQLLM